MRKILNAAIVMAIATICSCSTNDPSSSPEVPGGHEYVVVKELKNWVDAAKDAVSRGGYLVEIGSQAEQNAVYKAIRDAGVSSSYTTVNDGGGVAYVWVGAMAAAGRTWVWNGANASGTRPVFWMGDSDGAPVAQSYVNWGGRSAGKYNEPDNFTDAVVSPDGQNAAAIGLTAWPQGSSSPLGVAGEWNDIAGSNKLYYVVEIE